MSKSKLINWGAVPLLAAMLAVGCEKEEQTHGLRIVEENMESNGAKVVVDTSDARHSSWKDYEDYVGIFQAGYAEKKSFMVYKGSEGYYLDDDVPWGGFLPTANFVAWYPYANLDIATSPDTVFIRQVDGSHEFYDDGSMTVKYPMVAFGNASTTVLEFRHITGMMSFTVENNSSEDFPIAGVSLHAFKNEQPFVLFPTSNADGSYFLCCKDANGKLVVENYAHDAYMHYNVTDHEQNAGCGNCPVLKAGETMRFFLPVPQTEHTDFRFTLKRAEQVGGWWSDASSGHVKRKISDITIQRNHILNLPKIQIQ